MILERREWREYYPDGSPWITGQIGIVSELGKHLYDYRTGFQNLKGVPVCRLGVWTKFTPNGQIAWALDYGDGLLDKKFKR